MAGKCAHEDSRLTCIDCAAVICSRCLVQCPVGFRCRACVDSVKDGLTSQTPMLLVRTAAVCIGLGFAAGWIMPFINVPFLGCIICYFFGLFAGRILVAKVIDQRLGNKVTKIIVFGILIGMSLSPYNMLPLLMVESLASSFAGHGTVFDSLTEIVNCLFSPVCFMVGVLRPTVWGERW